MEFPCKNGTPDPHPSHFQAESSAKSIIRTFVYPHSGQGIRMRPFKGPQVEDLGRRGAGGASSIETGSSDGSCAHSRLIAAATRVAPQDGGVCPTGQGAIYAWRRSAAMARSDGQSGAGLTSQNITTGRSQATLTAQSRHGGCAQAAASCGHTASRPSNRGASESANRLNGHPIDRGPAGNSNQFQPPKRGALPQSGVRPHPGQREARVRDQSRLAPTATLEKHQSQAPEDALYSAS